MGSRLRLRLPVAAVLGAIALPALASGGAGAQEHGVLSPRKLAVDAPAATGGADEEMPGRLVVRFATAVPDDAAILAAVGVDGARIAARIPALGAATVAVPPRLSATAAAHLRASEGVRSVAEDVAAEVTDCPDAAACLLPDDPELFQQWSILDDASTLVPAGLPVRLGADIDAPRAWRISRSSPAVRIGIVDTGIDPAHPDLAGQIAATASVSSDGSALDDQGHGTAVAGVAAAATDNGIGIAGVGYDAKLVAVRVSDGASDGSFSCSALAAGMVRAVALGARIVNVSAGSSAPCPLAADAARYVWEHDGLVIAAAGNDGHAAPTYPAAYPEVVSVAATDPADGRAAFSDFGASWVDLAAPGVAITTTLPTYPNRFGLLRYGMVDGTSFSAPIVAGVAALAWPQVRDVDGDGFVNDEVAQRLFAAARPIAGTGSLWRYGRIDACRAVAPAGCGAPSGTASSPSQSPARASSGAPRVASARRPAPAPRVSPSRARAAVRAALRRRLGRRFATARGYGARCVSTRSAAVTCHASWRIGRRRWSARAWVTARAGGAPRVRLRLARSAVEAPTGRVGRR